MLLTVAGLQVPVIPFVDVVGSVGATAPLQIGAIALKVGNTEGFTVIVTVTGVPTQPAAVGVMLKVTVPGIAPVAVSVCVMEVPLPETAPLAPVWVTVQA